MILGERGGVGVGWGGEDRGKKETRDEERWGERRNEAKRGVEEWREERTQQWQYRFNSLYSKQLAGWAVTFDLESFLHWYKLHDIFSLSVKSNVIKYGLKQSGSGCCRSLAGKGKEGRDAGSCSLRVIWGSSDKVVTSLQSCSHLTHDLWMWHRGCRWWASPQRGRLRSEIDLQQWLSEQTKKH